MNDSTKEFLEYLADSLTEEDKIEIVLKNKIVSEIVADGWHPVTLCKDCESWNKFADGATGLCKHKNHIMPTSRDFFCSDGKPKE